MATQDQTPSQIVIDQPRPNGGRIPGEPRPTARQPFTRRHRPIIKLLTETNLPREQIASLTGVSEGTVGRIKRILKANGLGERPVTGAERYQRLLRKRIPDGTRAEQLERLVKLPKTSEFARLKAVQYVDSVLGLAPEQQQQADAQPEVRPMFSFAAGSQVVVSVHTESKRNGKQARAPASKDPDA